MNRRRTPWLAIGLLIASATASAVLGIAALLALPAADAGDLAVSAIPGTANLAAVLAGTSLLVAVELLRASSRRAARRAASASTAA